jgi:hypothetical protein
MLRTTGTDHDGGRGEEAAAHFAQRDFGGRHGARGKPKAELLDTETLSAGALETWTRVALARRQILARQPAHAPQDRETDRGHSHPRREAAITSYSMRPSLSTIMPTPAHRPHRQPTEAASR